MFEVETVTLIAATLHTLDGRGGTESTLIGLYDDRDAAEFDSARRDLPAGDVEFSEVAVSEKAAAKIGRAAGIGEQTSTRENNLETVAGLIEVFDAGVSFHLLHGNAQGYAVQVDRLQGQGFETTGEYDDLNNAIANARTHIRSWPDVRITTLNHAGD